MKIRILFEKLYIKFICKQKINYLPSSLIEHYPLIAGNKFYKFAFRNEEFFYFEKSNIQYLKNLNGVAKYIPEYEYHFKYFKTDKLNLIKNKDEHLKYAEEILTAFKKYGEYKYTKLEDLEFINKGLLLIKAITNEKTYQHYKNRVVDILSKTKFRIGICHGDFHPKNLLKNDKSPILIDFDCVRKSSIQEFDCLYFVVQSMIDYDYENIWWHKAITYDISGYHDFVSKFIDNSINMEDLKLIFSIDRIGQDSKYYPKIQNNPINDIIEYLETALA